MKVLKEKGNKSHNNFTKNKYNGISLRWEVCWSVSKYLFRGWGVWSSDSLLIHVSSSEVWQFCWDFRLKYGWQLIMYVGSLCTHPTYLPKLIEMFKVSFQQTTCILFNRKTLKTASILLTPFPSEWLFCIWMNFPYISLPHAPLCLPELNKILRTSFQYIAHILFDTNHSDTVWFWVLVKTSFWDDFPILEEYCSSLHWPLLLCLLELKKMLRIPF